MVDVPVISTFLIIAVYTFVRPRTMVLLAYVFYFVNNFSTFSFFLCHHKYQFHAIRDSQEGKQ